MIDERDLFERTARRFDPPIDSLERLLVRRDRRRRNQRIATVTFALLIAIVGIWGVIRVLANAERQLPANRIDRTNVHDLKLAWSARLQGADASVRFRSLGYEAPYAPVVGDGMVFVGTDAGKIYGFTTSCGTAGGSCRPAWVGSTGAGIASSPTAADGLVLAGSQDGFLYAFPADCGSGGATCAPSWRGRTGHAVQSPVVAGRIVYSFDVRTGMVYAFAEDCATDGSVCDPLWSKPTEPTRATNGFVVNDVPWRLAVYDGIVFAIAKGDHDGLYAFDATSGRPLWKHTEAFTGSLSPFNTPVLESGFVLANLGEEGLQAFPIRCRTDAGQCGASWTSSPGSFISSGGGIVYTNGWTSGTAGTAYALPANCGTGGATCKPLWTAPDDGWGETAAGEGKLFVTSIAGDALDAFPATCSDPCEADWTAHGIGGPRWAPVVENGLVYVGSADGSLHAFSVSCGTGGQTCEPIWSRRVPDSVMSPPAIAGTRLFAVTLDGRLVSFEIPTSNQTRSPSSAPFWLGLVSLGALVMLLVVRAVRSRSI